MTQTKPKKTGMHRSTKFLLASLSTTATLSGWAWLTLTAPPPVTEAEEPEPIETAANLESIALRQPTLAVVTTPMPPLPKLGSLPVRGLRYVGDPVPTKVAPTNVPQVQSQTEPQQQPQGSQKREKADPAPQQPPPPAEKPPPPPPKRKTKSSK